MKKKRKINIQLFAEPKPSEEDGSDLSEIEIAELANAQIKKRDAEIAKLKKELAKEKLLSTVPEPEKPKRKSSEECKKIIASGTACNYDYTDAVCDLVDNEVEAGNPHPLGDEGENIRELFGEALKKCDGDKSRFMTTYDSLVQKDDAKIKAAYDKRNKQK